MKSNRDPYRVEVGERLRITAAELGLPTATLFAEHIGLERPAVDAWFNGKALVPVQCMLPICERYYITLDWIYRGDASGLPMSRGIRLLAAMAGDDVPAAVRQPVSADKPASAARSKAAAEPVRKPVRRRSKASESHAG
jgi:hypothetical protein